MTKLEAVNVVLQGAGIYPVPALATGTGSAAGIAEKMIDECQRRIENEEWHFSTQRDLVITGDGSGQMAIPSGTITIETYGQDEWRDVTQDPGGTAYLYDRDNQTLNFGVGEELHVRVTTRLTFDQTHPLVQEYIAAEAAVTYNERFGFAARQPALAAKRDKARYIAKQYDTRERNRNFLNTSEMIRLRGSRKTVVFWGGDPQ